MKTAALTLLGALLFLGLALASGREPDAPGVDRIDLRPGPATAELVEAPTPDPDPVSEAARAGETTTVVRPVSRPVRRRPAADPKAATATPVATTTPVTAAAADDHDRIAKPRKTRHPSDRARDDDSDRPGGRGQTHGRHGRR
jgi:hypothetical protein